MPASAPVWGKFDQDPRVSFDKVAGKWQYEDEETSQEFEWSEHAKAWIPLIDESQWQAQQSAYSVAGVDESTPANAVIAREERRNKKRKKGDKGDTEPDLASITGGPSTSSASSSKSNQQPGSSFTPTSTSSAAQPPVPPHSGTHNGPKNTAVFVSHLPPNTTASQLASVFSKCGVLMIGDDGEPRVKLYYDDEGKFKGEALVMYFKEASVDLAIKLLDDSELEMGAGFGNMLVKAAQYEKGSKSSKEDKKAEGVEGSTSASTSTSNGAKATGAGLSNGEPGGSGSGNGNQKKKPTAEDKARMTKRIKSMQEKITWGELDEIDDPLAPEGGAPPPGQNRYNRVVVLKGMFTTEDLERDPALILELKEDVRDECGTLGQVTSVILYDKEADGVMTIKFKDPISAQACVMKMNGRFFDKRQIYAGLYTGKERFKRSDKGVDLLDGDKDEQDRLDSFAQWLVEDAE